MTHRRHTRALGLALAAAFAISGCSSGTATLTTTLPTGCTNPHSAFGAVCSVTGSATVGANSSPGPGDPVDKGARISTSSGGNIEFWISVKIKKCEIFGGSNGALTVWPASSSPQVLIHYEAGDVVCSTLRHGPVTMSAGPHALLHLTDPVFAVLINPAGFVTIQVITGEVTVSSNIGPPVALGPERQVTVGPTGAIAASARFIPESKAEIEAIRQVER
jgi:hypothetical protein